MSNHERGRSGVTERLFIAIQLPAEVRLQLDAWKRQLKQHYEFNKWVHTEDLQVAGHRVCTLPVPFAALAHV